MRSDKEIEANTFDVNKALGIDESTMPNHGFPDPFISAQFYGKLLFIALYQSASRTHYHFLYNPSSQKIEGKSHSCELINPYRDNNFPLKSFYNDERNEFYVFYR